MKISGKAYNDLKKYIDDVLQESNYESYSAILEYYVSNKIGKDPKVRARWDIFWLASNKYTKLVNDGSLKVNPISEICNADGVYNSHIDTALKKITGIR